MSATGRGAKRRVDDNYSTPTWVVRSILAAIGPNGPAIPCSGGLWMEPCAGRGAIIRAVQESGLASPAWVAVEKRKACAKALKKIDSTQVEIMDFLKWHAGTGFPVYDNGVPEVDVLLTNPPFSLAMEFIEHARKVLPGTLLVFLLRLNFLESQKRAAFFRENMPDVYVLPKRPSFTGNGTDATGYCWAIWRPRLEGRRPYGTVSVLDLPKSEL